ncbi:MAG: family 14 glycosylhydrolase [bacterium]|nr:family 14 glycosylhydrolase [bacterium]
MISRLVVVSFCLASLAGGVCGPGVSSAAAPSSTPAGKVSGRAKSVDDIPFIGGKTEAVKLLGLQSEATITERAIPGQTHDEIFFYWRYLEPVKDQWDFSYFNRLYDLAHARGLRFQIYSWDHFAPAWFKQTPDYVRLTELRTGKSVDALSPWAPGTLRAIDHIYAGIKAHVGDKIDLITIGYPAADYGEIGLILRTPQFIPGGVWYQYFPQDDDAWHAGYWCGDPYARRDFQAWAVAHYGSLEALGAAWGVKLASPASIEFPDPDKRYQDRRRWLDFLDWYQGSQTRFTAAMIAAVRKHYPSKPLSVKIGFGSDDPCLGLDRTAVCRAVARFNPFTIRSTHGAFSRNPHGPAAYWYYKRMAPVCRKLDVGFGSETPADDLTEAELLRQMFEEASVGLDYVMQRSGNFHLRPGLVADYKRVLRPTEPTLVDIGILYPTTQVLLDAAKFPKDQHLFCTPGRFFFDYDIVDRNMIEWGWLADYRVLVHTSGRVYEQNELDGIDRWLRAGGMLVMHGDDPWETVAGDTSVMKGWLASPASPVPGGAGQVRSVGRGHVIVLPPGDMAVYLAAVVKTLDAARDSGLVPAPLRGFNTLDTKQMATEFATGWLLFDPATCRISFRPISGDGRIAADAAWTIGPVGERAEPKR